MRREFIFIALLLGSALAACSSSSSSGGTAPQYANIQGQWTFTGMGAGGSPTNLAGLVIFADITQSGAGFTSAQYRPGECHRQ
jgi:hypothetical protein